MEEIWRDIKNFEGSFQVSNYGNIRSLDREDRRGCFHKGILLKKSIVNDRFYIVLSVNNKSFTSTISTLVAKAFPEICGEWFEGCHVHHKDLNHRNDNADNLVVLSQKEHYAIHNPKKDKWANWRATYL